MTTTDGDVMAGLTCTTWDGVQERLTTELGAALAHDPEQGAFRVTAACGAGLRVQHSCTTGDVLITEVLVGAGFEPRPLDEWVLAVLDFEEADLVPAAAPGMTGFWREYDVADFRVAAADTIRLLSSVFRLDAQECSLSIEPAESSAPVP